MVEVTYDGGGDVLYTKVEGEVISNSNQSETDSYLIIDRNGKDCVVGTTLLAASEMPLDFWRDTQGYHNELPEEVFKAIEEWIKTR